MIKKTRGIVLHTTAYAEASIIAKVYTDDAGMQSFLINGVRKQKARFASNLFQPLSIIELVAYFKKPGGLHRVSEVNPSPALHTIPYDTVKSTMAIFLAEVLYKSIREEETNPELFHFLDHAIQMLDVHTEATGRFHLSFLIQFSKYLGFYPHGRYSASSPWFDMKEGYFREERPSHPYFMSRDLSRLLDTLIEINLESVSELKISAIERKLLLEGLIGYYELHHTQGQTIQSHHVLAEVMS